MITKIILCTVLYTVSATVGIATQFAENTQDIFHERASASKERNNASKEPASNKLIDDASRIKSLSSENFFDIQNKSEEFYDKGDFYNSAINYIGCAIDMEMGEDYQHVLYKINPQSLTWIEKKDFNQIATLVKDLQLHLRQQSETQIKKSKEHHQKGHSNDTNHKPSITFHEIK